jgi:[ribosomal protein S5]-alanine N-acetyltransferase
VEQGVILETSRLLLREFRAEDSDPMFAVLGDPEAMRFYPAPFARAGVEAWITRNQERYRREGFGLWAMVLNSTGEVIGDCGCVLQDVENRREIEIGYHVRRDLWGKGYATEAARACLEHAFSRLRAPRVVSMIRPENLNSRRVAEKNGLKCDRLIFWHGYEHCIYAMTKQQWAG